MYGRVLAQQRPRRVVSPRCHSGLARLVRSVVFRGEHPWMSFHKTAMKWIG